MVCRLAKLLKRLVLVKARRTTFIAQESATSNNYWRKGTMLVLEQMFTRWEDIAAHECQVKNVDGVECAVITVGETSEKLYIPGAEFGFIADAGILMHSLVELFKAKELLYAIENSTGGMNYVSLISLKNGTVVSFGEDRSLVIALLKAYLDLLENLSTEVRAA